MGIRVEYSHHEVAPGQHEIDLKFDEAVAMADKTMTYRITVKEIARGKGCYTTFLPILPSSRLRSSAFILLKSKELILITTNFFCPFFNYL
jgi:glutamine synthetase